ncbi:MAG: protein kinase, partial [Candidatus Sumerlaeia bacterium]|nr:protein kinase [Candidatus Sumerlaeia bacterium]
IEAVSDEDPPEEFLLAVARVLVESGVEHPRKWFFVEQALRINPEDEVLERAMAEGMAARGKPALALKIVRRHIESNKAEEATVDLLHSVKTFCAPPLPRETLRQIHELVVTREQLPPRVTLAAMELFLHDGRRCNKGDLAILQRLLEAFPRNVRVKHWMAQCLSDAGDSVRAAELLSELIDDGPGNDEAVLELARTHARLGSRDSENYRVARAAVALEPEDMELRLHLASIELNLENFRSASRHLDEILQEQPELHPKVLALLQASLGKEHESGEILLTLARAHVIAGKNEQALEVLSRLKNRYHHHLSAMMDLYGDILSSAPDNLRARLGRAVLLRLAGRVEEAATDLEFAHRQSPDNMEILAEYAAVMNQKINAEPTVSPELCISVAEMQLRLGDDDAAYELARRALKLNPDHDPALKLMARLHLLDYALQLCWSTLQSLSDRASALPLYQQLASAFAEDGDHLKAAEVLTDALEIGGPQRELLEQLRSLHQRQAEASKGSMERQAILGSLSDRAQGRYELREEIGSGSMGVVYKAHDRELDEIVVLKILPEHFANNEKALMRFRHEAKAARKLAHPNIVRIHDFGEEGGRKHISMEYVSGGDLKDFFRRCQGNIGVHRAIQIIRQVAHALSHAHAEGILHRDIKAANILLTASGKAKLSDFGISALIEEVNKEYATPHSSQGILGTPLYMAPEQFRAESLTQATDLYATGVLFYELLSGKPPFTRGSISYHQQFTPPKPLENIPGELWEIVGKLLHKNPAERFQSAEDLIEALNLFAETGWSPIV